MEQDGTTIEAKMVKIQKIMQIITLDLKMVYGLGYSIKKEELIDSNVEVEEINVVLVSKA